MRFRIELSTLFVASVILVSCSKETDVETPLAGNNGEMVDNATIDQYSLLQEGNYWVYEQTRLDSAGNFISNTTTVDTVLVVGDSLIDGVTWKKMTGKWEMQFPTLRLFRDSLNFMVLRGHGPVFAVGADPIFLTESVIPNLVTIQYFATPEVIDLTSPLGILRCKAVITEITSTGGPIPPADRLPFSLWSPGYGEVLYRVFYYSSGEGFERKLIAYSVQ